MRRRNHRFVRAPHESPMSRTSAPQTNVNLRPPTRAAISGSFARGGTLRSDPAAPTFRSRPSSSAVPCRLSSPGLSTPSFATCRRPSCRTCWRRLGRPFSARAGKTTPPPHRNSPSGFFAERRIGGAHESEVNLRREFCPREQLVAAAFFGHLLQLLPRFGTSLL